MGGCESSRIVGRERERRELIDALRGGRSVWVHGPPGIGKSSLLLAIAASWDSREEGCMLLYAADCATRRTLLRSVLESLLEVRGSIRGPGSRTIRTPEALRRFVSSARRRELAAAVHETVGGRPTIRVLDHLNAHGARLETYVENLLFESTPVVLVTANRAELGPLERLLFAVEPFEVPPLPRAQAHELIRRWLPEAPLEAHSDLVRHASGNPGRLHGLARLARKEKYWRGKRLNLRLLELDSNIAAIARGDR